MVRIFYEKIWIDEYLNRCKILTIEKHANQHRLKVHLVDKLWLQEHTRNNSRR